MAQALGKSLEELSKLLSYNDDAKTSSEKGAYRQIVMWLHQIIMYFGIGENISIIKQVLKTSQQNFTIQLRVGQVVLWFIKGKL